MKDLRFNSVGLLWGSGGILHTNVIEVFKEFRVMLRDF